MEAVYRPDPTNQPIRQEVWGKEGFVHDPSGILWHIGEFSKGQ